jgi:heme-degrading monooxygenase HmoA
MLLILWEFVVKKDRVDDFEALYREDGAWSELFRRSPGFVSTTLWHDLKDPLRFVVADRWTGEEGFEGFRREHAEAYRALDERCRRLTERETELGRFGSRS